MTDLERYKDMLMRELQDAPYVKDSLLGHAGSDRKLRWYICTCVKENVPEIECIQWFEENIGKELTNQDEIEKIKMIISGAYLCKK